MSNRKSTESWDLLFTLALAFYPLPQERKQQTAGSGFGYERPIKPVAGCSEGRGMILLLLGEKAGMRESVN